MGRKEQKTFKIRISRDLIYDYEIKAIDEASAIARAIYCFESDETENVKLLNEECIDASVMNCEEKTNGKR